MVKNSYTNHYRGINDQSRALSSPPVPTTAPVVPYLHHPVSLIHHLEVYHNIPDNFNSNKQNRTTLTISRFTKVCLESAKISLQEEEIFSKEGMTKTKISL